MYFFQGNTYSFFQLVFFYRLIPVLFSNVCVCSWKKWSFYRLSAGNESLNSPRFLPFCRSDGCGWSLPDGRWLHPGEHRRDAGSPGCLHLLSQHCWWATCRWTPHSARRQFHPSLANKISTEAEERTIFTSIPHQLLQLPHLNHQLTTALLAPTWTTHTFFLLIIIPIIMT